MSKVKDQPNSHDAGELKLIPYLSEGSFNGEDYEDKGWQGMNNKWRLFLVSGWQSREGTASDLGGKREQSNFLDQRCSVSV